LLSNKNEKEEEKSRKRKVLLGANISILEIFIVEQK
jgi:hypothetical protein